MVWEKQEWNWVMLTFILKRKAKFKLTHLLLVGISQEKISGNAKEAVVQMV
jgi:hypothetical protein